MKSILVATVVLVLSLPGVTSAQSLNGATVTAGYDTHHAGAVNYNPWFHGDGWWPYRCYNTQALWDSYCHPHSYHHAGSSRGPRHSYHGLGSLEYLTGGHGACSACGTGVTEVNEAAPTDESADH